MTHTDWILQCKKFEKIWLNGQCMWHLVSLEHHTTEVDVMDSWKDIIIQL